MSEHKYFEINKIDNAPFKYILSIGPIDYFQFTLTKQQLTENIKSENSDIGINEDHVCRLNLNGLIFDNVNELEKYIIDYVSSIEEKPHTIRYLSIPSPYNWNSN